MAALADEGTGRQTAERTREAVAAHVTDTEAPVYGIVDLPEEVIAVILAYVSRSPKGFRENLGELMAQGLAGGTEAAGGPQQAFAAASERARAFHERWVVNYGHASVAEHATVHLGVEAISRLASAELELANPFLSFTEFSQRYQAPRRGGFVTPPELDTAAPALQERYARTQGQLFDAYEALREGIAQHLLQSGEVTRREGEAPEAALRRARRKAFEDARYALSLATETALGLTANGRALRDAIALLAEHPRGEVRTLAERLRVQGERMLPTLLRHAEPAVAPPGRAPAPTPAPFGAGAEVRLLGVFPEGDGAAAIDALAAALRLAGLPEAAAAPVAYLRARRAESGPYAPAHTVLRTLRYRFALCLSEANWHQFLRHIRGMALLPAPPGVADGIMVPPLVAASGLSDLLEEAAAQGAALYDALAQGVGHGAAAYAVTNAHRRWVVADLDLWEMDHLVRLRLRANAQWDVRRTVRAMVRHAVHVHPFLSDLWGADVTVAPTDEPQ